ncbi:MAG: hypothetical protein ABL958_08135 [Bdellovibrionia bacterium]
MNTKPLSVLLFSLLIGANASTAAANGLCRALLEQDGLLSTDVRRYEDSQLREENEILVRQLVGEVRRTRPVRANEQIDFGTENTIDLNDHRGQTYYTFMKETVFPRLKDIATNGFKVADTATVMDSLGKVSDKVAAAAIKAAGNEANLEKILGELEGKNATVYDLHDKIRAAVTKLKIKGRVDQYKLSTFIALASGGGLAIRVDANNIAYNVNYGRGDKDKDRQTGRSFGEGPERKAEDASDKNYLKMLQDHVFNENPAPFYTTLFKLLLDNDVRGYSKVSPLGQTVLTDFKAVYTAEADRGLMPGRPLRWEEALFEVTLLAAFHSGQESVKIMYGGELRAKVPKQAPGGELDPSRTQDSSMIDYWQFSKQDGSSRSGINITRRDFTLLGKHISDYMRKNHTELIENVERHLGDLDSGLKGNVFAELSGFLVNKDTPKSLTRKTNAITEDVILFLEKVKEEAGNITEWIDSLPKKKKSEDEEEAPRSRSRAS